MNLQDRVDSFRKRTAQSVVDGLPDTELGRLFRQAYEKYGAQCLWNCKPTLSEEGVKVVVERLQKYGDLRAWYLAADILEESKNAIQFSI